MVIVMKAALLLALLIAFPISFYPDEITNSVIAPRGSEDEITHAYRIFSKTGDYEEKKKTLKVFDEHYSDNRVEDMITDLLVHFYDKDNFAENNQIMYYDDVIAGELIKILGKSGTTKGFPVYLKIVLNSGNHRDETVKEAWSAMEKIKW